jgi:hypothetical protein
MKCTSLALERKWNTTLGLGWVKSQDLMPKPKPFLGHFGFGSGRAVWTGQFLGFLRAQEPFLEPRQQPNHRIVCPNPTRLAFRLGRVCLGQVIFPESLPKPNPQPVGSWVRFGLAHPITILTTPCNLFRSPSLPYLSPLPLQFKPYPENRKSALQCLNKCAFGIVTQTDYHNVRAS